MRRRCGPAQPTRADPADLADRDWYQQSISAWKRLFGRILPLGRSEVVKRVGGGIRAGSSRPGGGWTSTDRGWSSPRPPASRRRSCRSAAGRSARPCNRPEREPLEQLGGRVRQFAGQCLIVEILEQAVSKLVIHLVDSSDDLLRQFTVNQL